MRAMMSRLWSWLRRSDTALPPALPTPEQQEVLDVINRVEQKLEARQRDRQRMFDLHADVMTRQEPNADVR